MAYERRDKKCQKSYRKGNETEGKKERGGVPPLCDLIYHFLPGPLRSHHIDLLAISRTYQANFHIRAVYICSSWQTLSPDIHVCSLTFFRSLLKYHLITDPFAYFYWGLFACFFLTTLQKIPAFLTFLVYFISFPSTYLPLIHTYFFMYCLPEYVRPSLGSRCTS